MNDLEKVKKELNDGFIEIEDNALIVKIKVDHRIVKHMNEQVAKYEKSIDKIVASLLDDLKTHK